MTGVSHRVGRLVLEAAIPDMDGAMALRRRVEALAWQAMPGVLEKVCERVAPSDTVLEVARLDLDLGTVRPDHLEEDALAAFEMALGEALVGAVHAARVAPSEGARLVPLPQRRLERFEHYLASGTDPGGAKDEAPAAQLMQLLADQPKALAAMLRRRANNRHLLERLVIQAGADGMRALLDMLAPAEAAVILTLLADIILVHRRPSVARRVHIAEPALERLLWITTLDFLLRDAGSNFNRRRFLGLLLQREAARAGIGYAALLDLLSAALEEAGAKIGLRSTLPILLTELIDETVSAGSHLAVMPTDALAAARSGRFEPLIAELAGHAKDRRALIDLAARIGDAPLPGLFQALDPAHATAIMAELGRLRALHRSTPLLPVDARRFGQVVAGLTLGAWSAPAATTFAARRRWFAAALAAEARLPIATLVGWLRYGMISADAAVPELHALAHRADGRAILAERLGGLTTAQFAHLVAQLQPTAAPMILAELAVLERQVRELASPSATRLSTLLRSLAVAPLLAARDFDPGRWRRHLRNDLAAALAIPAARLARPDGAAEESTVPYRDGAPAHLLLLAMLESDPGGAPATLHALVRATPERRRHRLLAQFAPADAEADAAMIALLCTLHAASPLAAFDRRIFGDRLWAALLACRATPSGARYDRLAVWRVLLASIAEGGAAAVERLSASVAQRLRGREPAVSAVASAAPAIATALADAGSAQTGADDDIIAFLETGRQTGAGLALVQLAASNPTRLAMLVRDHVRRAPDTIPQLIARLLDWLQPMELLDCLSSDCATQALHWAGGLARGELGDWQPILIAVLRGDKPDFVISPARAAARHDRVALVAHWLTRGTGPWWAPDAKAVATALASATQAELTTLFLADDPAETVTRLQRAAAVLGRIGARRLFERLAPWAARTNGPLAHLHAGRDAAARDDLLLRAAAAALAGDSLDLAALAVPLAPLQPPQAVPSVPHSASSPTRDAVLEWLEGKGSTVDADRMSRHFADLADASDTVLRDYVAKHRSNAAARRRWVALLPPEALRRLLVMLAPAVAGVLADATVLIAATWRQIAGFGVRRPPSTTVWQELVALAAAPGPVAIEPAIARLVALHAGDAAGQADALVDAAIRRAADSGNVGVGAVLRRLAARRAAQPTSSPPPQQRRLASPSRNDIDGVAAPADEPGAAVHIENAGLVLFGPYLPLLFERLGLLSRTEAGGQGIAGIDALSRAVHLLQYLVDGRCDAPEPRLALNKLLCGAPLAQPILAAIDPADADLELCDGLLTAMHGNWPMLSGTSRAGLRETFLQRRGRLLRTEAHWTLTVQRRSGIDALVDHIPWSFAVVYHRWMADPVHVTW